MPDEPLFADFRDANPTPALQAANERAGAAARRAPGMVQSLRKPRLHPPGSGIVTNGHRCQSLSILRRILLSSTPSPPDAIHSEVEAGVAGRNWPCEGSSVGDSRCQTARVVHGHNCRSSSRPFFHR